MPVNVTRERALAAWWHVDTGARPGKIETFAVASETLVGRNGLQPAAQTAGRG